MSWLLIDGFQSYLTLIMVVANLAITKRKKNFKKYWHMGTYLRVLSESFPMNINMTGLKWFSNIFFLVLWTKIDLALEGLNTFLTVHWLGMYNQYRLGIVKIIKITPMQIHKMFILQTSNRKFTKGWYSQKKYLNLTIFSSLFKHPSK